MARAHHLRRHGDRRVRGEPHGAAAGAAGKCGRASRARRRAADPARARSGGGQSHGEGAELALGAAEAGDRKPHAAGRGRRPRSPHADHPHAARAEFVEDEEDRARWLTDLDELERIADSAILLVREESGKAPPELIQLDELVGSIGAELRDQKLDVTETTAEPVTVRASRLTLNRALRNLIINAATHGVRARVEVDGAKATARIVIEDEGPGIPPDLLGQVFEPFFRADPARRQDIPGAGLASPSRGRSSSVPAARSASPTGRGGAEASGRAAAGGGSPCVRRSWRQHPPCLRSVQSAAYDPTQGAGRTPAAY